MNWPDKEKIDYILYHLQLTVHLPDGFYEYFRFGGDPHVAESKPAVYFVISEDEFDFERVITLQNLPVLFPVADKPEFYSLDGNKLIFHHDLLKSAFYLLSGYQEYKTDKADHFGRYPYAYSLQKRLGIVSLPLVNYYFKMISEALEKFFNINKIHGYKEKKVFEKPVAMLTHDVDRLDRYTINSLLYKAKQVIGLTKRYHPLTKEILLLLEEKIQLMKFWNRRNPVWDFDDIRKLEKRFGFNSVYFFLDKDLKYQDAYYDLNEKRVNKLITTLYEDDCEIALHGTTRSAGQPEAMRKLLKKIRAVSPAQVAGIRQHRLIYKNPQTLKIHEEHDFQYDSTLCFAEHEGFRNSYCLPFRLFDHQRNKMTHVWEIPLNVMDTTLFAYRNYTVKEAFEAVKKILTEVSKFSGVFTLLWHNGFADENRWPGSGRFYEMVLKEIHRRNYQALTGKHIISISEQAANGK